MSKWRAVEEINAENFSPVGEIAFIYVDETPRDRIKVNDFEFLTRPDYDPYKTEFCIQSGIIRYLPEVLPVGYENLKVGDRVFCSHHLINEKNAVIVNGEKLRTLEFVMIYFVKNGDDIKLLGSNNLLEPVYEDESNWKTGSGLLLKPNLEKVPMRGKAKYVNAIMSSDGVSSGDILVLRKNSEYDIDVDGEILYVVHDNDILAVI